MNHDDNQQPSTGEGNHDPYDGVDGFEPPARTEDQGHPLADNNFDVEAFFEVLKLTFDRLKESPVLIVLIGLSAISLLWSLFVGGSQFMAHLFLGSTGSGVVGLVLTFVGMFLYPMMLVVAVAQMALYRPASGLLFGSGIETDDPVEVLESITGLLVPVGLAMLGYLVAVGIGTLMCVIPGIVAAVLFSQAPYLVAVRDFGLVDAFKASVERTLEHWHLVAMAIGSVLIVSVGASVVFGCLGSVAGFMEPMNLVTSPILSWLSGTLIAIATFIVYLGAFGTIDELEGLDSIEW